MYDDTLIEHTNNFPILGAIGLAYSIIGNYVRYTDNYNIILNSIKFSHKFKAYKLVSYERKNTPLIVPLFLPQTMPFFIHLYMNNNTTSVIEYTFTKINNKTLFINNLNSNRIFKESYQKRNDIDEILDKYNINIDRLGMTYPLYLYETSELPMFYTNKYFHKNKNKLLKKILFKRRLPLSFTISFISIISILLEYPYNLN